MVIVEDLNEGLNLGPLLDLLLAHFLCDRAWVSGDPSNKCMAVRFIRGTVIVVLQKQTNKYKTVIKLALRPEDSTIKSHYLPRRDLGQVFHS